MNLAGWTLRAGRVLITGFLVLVGLASAQAALADLRAGGRDVAALAFGRCLVAVFAWALALAVWRWTRERITRQRTANGAPPGPADSSVDQSAKTPAEDRSPADDR